MNYLSDVLPQTRKLSQPSCPVCGNKYNLWAYLLYRKCGNCGKPRALRTWLVQGFLTILPIFMWLFPGEKLPFTLELAILIFLTLVLVIDLEHRLILHPVSMAGAVLGVITGLFLRGRESISHGVIYTLLGGVVGFGIMLVLYYLGELFVKYMSKKRGLPADEVALGFGDVNLSGILGLMLGWQIIFTCLFFAILAGGFVSLLIIIAMLISRKFKAFTAIPYAPFLILSAGYFLFMVR